MRDASSVQFDATLSARDSAATSLWIDVTVSAADGGVRVVPLSFATPRFAASSANLASEAAATIAAHDAIVGSTANGLPATGLSSETLLAAVDGTSIDASKPVSTAFKAAAQAECDRVLAIAIALSPPPAVDLSQAELQLPATSSLSTTNLAAIPASVFSDRTVDIDLPPFEISGES